MTGTRGERILKIVVLAEIYYLFKHAGVIVCVLFLRHIKSKTGKRTMPKTQLLYLSDFRQLSCDTHVIFIEQEGDRFVIILDQTVFYPQGGGQPADQGKITAQDTIFTVSDVRMVDGVVQHKGFFTGQPFTVGQQVNCQVDDVRRTLNSRVHSAGHVIDKALFELGYMWLPGKSYHFPAGPYVEYSGSLNGVVVGKLKTDIESLCAHWCNNGLAVTSRVFDKNQVMSDEQLKRRCQFIANLPDDTPIYVIAYGDNFSSPCSGTHVSDVAEIKDITIRKIKESDGVIRISYSVA